MSGAASRFARVRPGVRATIALALVLMLSGCTDSAGMIDLQNYVSGVVNRPPGAIEPPPQFVSFEPFTYSAANLRGPFDPPIDATAAMRSLQNNDVRPDENRVREPLESFALSSLTMVGTLERGGVRSALVRDETSQITRVGVGTYLGRNHGRIVEITERQINLVEIVPTGNGGWVERPQSIAMAP
jgi:type IV pilus assembly protein PilP